MARITKANAVANMTNVFAKALRLGDEWQSMLDEAHQCAQHVTREECKALIAPALVQKYNAQWDEERAVWVGANEHTPTNTAKTYARRWLDAVYGKPEGKRVAPKKDAPMTLAEKYEAMTPAERKRFLRLIGVM